MNKKNQSKGLYYLLSPLKAWLILGRNEISNQEEQKVTRAFKVYLLFLFLEPMDSFDLKRPHMAYYYHNRKFGPKWNLLILLLKVI